MSPKPKRSFLLLAFLWHFCLYFAFVMATRSICSSSSGSFRRYFKVKNCAKSSERVVARRRAEEVEDCFKFAREKDAFALNFGPVDVAKEYYNCHLFACPVFQNYSSLSNHTDYDYYSSYANLNVMANSTCIPSVGVFKLFTHELNYTSAVLKCQEHGGDLANILSEYRTDSLADLLKTSLPNLWYKAAYVGLDDMDQEGRFETASGDFLNCHKYRAWAPGHPRATKAEEDCVVLDSERTWRVVDCRQNLPFVCELFPEGPAIKNNSGVDEDCSYAQDSREYEECLSELSNDYRDEECVRV